MEQVQGQPRLWKGYFGYVRFDALSEWCVIDRCAAESSVVEFRVNGGGTRSYGLRPRAVDPGILQNRASFFQGLRASVSEVGIKVPLLVWGINGKYYLRYGASRAYVAEKLGLERAPAILCLFTGAEPFAGFYPIRALTSPADVLDAMGPLSSVGHFIVDHERIDIHRAEPEGIDPLP